MKRPRLRRKPHRPKTRSYQGSPGGLPFHLWALPIFFFALTLTIWVGTFFPLPSGPTRWMLASLVFLLGIPAGFLILVLWWTYYMGAVLPIRSPQERQLLWRLGLYYLTHRHGPAYFVMNGKKLETYNPRHGGWQVVVLDNGSAALALSALGREYVLGPGVHFLPPGVRLKAFFDLREYSLRIPEKPPSDKGARCETFPTCSRTADGAEIAATISLTCFLEDFSYAPDWDEEDRRLAERLWEQEFQRPPEVLHQEGKVFSPFHGHEASILRAYQFSEVPEEEFQPWWKLTRGVAMELWHHLAQKYTLDELFPSNWSIVQRTREQPSFQTGFEKLLREYRERLTRPRYYHPQKNKWLPSPEFHRLLRQGVRIRTANIVEVHLSPAGDAAMLAGYIDPLVRRLEAEQEKMRMQRGHLSELARILLLSEWLIHLANRLEESPTFRSMLQVYDAENGAGEAQRVELFQEEALLDALEALVRAWRALAEEPGAGFHHEVQALNRIETWIRTERARRGGNVWD